MRFFELLPKLAMAYWKAGDQDAARSAIKKAELALSVVTGILKCKETDAGFYLSSGSGYRPAGEAAGDVVGRMCGAAYGYVYQSRTLGRIPMEAEMVERYLAIRHEIELESE